MLTKENVLEVEDSDVAGEPARRASTSEQLQSPFKNASRIQQSLTAQLERQLLTWLAERMPSSINSDHLTLLGFLSMFLAGTCYALARWNQIGLTLATLCLVVNWFGDSLDGTLARVRSRQRPRYGFYVDHISDAFGAFFLMGGLAFSGYADSRIAFGMLVAFLMLSIEVHLATYTLGIFRLSFWKFGPTEARILLALGNTTLLFRPVVRVLGSSHRLFDVGGLLAITGMAIMLMIRTIWHTRELYQEERLP
jgi:archaetidylinositol phosphate synthase